MKNQMTPGEQRLCGILEGMNMVTSKHEIAKMFLLNVTKFETLAKSCGIGLEQAQKILDGFMQIDISAVDKAIKRQDKTDKEIREAKVDGYHETNNAIETIRSYIHGTNMSKPKKEQILDLISNIVKAHSKYTVYSGEEAKRLKNQVEDTGATRKTILQYRANQLEQEVDRKFHNLRYYVNRLGACDMEVALRNGFEELQELFVGVLALLACEKKANADLKLDSPQIDDLRCVPWEALTKQDLADIMRDYVAHVERIKLDHPNILFPTMHLSEQPNKEFKHPDIASVAEAGVHH